MPRYTPKSHEQILSAMIAKMVARTELNDVGDASVLKHLLAAAARQDSQQYYQANLLLQLFSIDTAAGEDLDERAKDIQPATMTRLPSVKSVGTVIFTRRGVTGSLSIPVGTKVKTSQGILFSTTALGSISASSPEQIAGHGVGRDSAPVPVIADIGGASGNVVALTVTGFTSKPAGIDTVTNLYKFNNGVDTETDDHFRNRLKNYVSSLARCNVSAIETQLLGKQDPISGASILFTKVVEDLINRGNITVYVDDGTGTAESVTNTASDLPGTWTWNGTTTVTATNTSTVTAGDFIRLKSVPTKWFQIQTVTPNVNVTILNPGSETIPTGATGSSLATEILTQGLAGPPPNSAVGGETTLYLNFIPIKNSEPISVVSSIRGNLTQTTDWILNPASGQVDFITALTAGEIIVVDYTYYVGLIAYAQKIVDGDANDRKNYPGYRAAGVLAIVKTPQVLFQTVEAVITVQDGYDQSTVRSAVQQAIIDYINALPISGDCLVSKLYETVMQVPGVYDVDLVTPVNNVILLDDQLLRTTQANVLVN